MCRTCIMNARWHALVFGPSSGTLDYGTFEISVPERWRIARGRTRADVSNVAGGGSHLFANSWWHRAYRHGIRGIGEAKRCHPRLCNAADGRGEEAPPSNATGTFNLCEGVGFVGDAGIVDSLGKTRACVDGNVDNRGACSLYSRGRVWAVAQPSAAGRRNRGHCQ